MKLIEYPDAEMMMMLLAQIIAADLEAALRVQDRVTLAVPGGTTPAPLFAGLSSVSLPWNRVRVLLTDERWVPESSDRSNTALLRQHLLVNHAAEAELLPLYSEGADTPEEALEQLEAAITPALPLNVCLLGMGADMHTASLFPGADLLDEALTGQGVLYPMRAPGAPEPRVTLSAHVLNQAIDRHIVIKGADKREALERALHASPQEAPVAAILPNTKVHWAAN